MFVEPCSTEGFIKHLRDSFAVIAVNDKCPFDIGGSRIRPLTGQIIIPLVHYIGNIYMYLQI